MDINNYYNTSLNNTHYTLSRCVKNRNYIYLSSNNTIRQKGYIFLLIEKISLLFWTPLIKNDYSPSKVIKQATADIQKSLKTPDACKAKSPQDILNAFKKTKQQINEISTNIDQLHERYKLGRITSWKDPFNYLIPSLGGSWQDFSTWLNLVLSVPQGIKKIFSLIKACLKTIYCWIRKSAGEQRLALEKEVADAHVLFNEAVNSCMKEFELVQNCCRGLDKNNLSKKDLLDVLDKAQIFIHQGFPAALFEALFNEAGIHLPPFGTPLFNDLLMVLKNPLFPHVLKPSNKQSLTKLISLAEDTTINDNTRRYFLKIVVEKLIAGQVVGSQGNENDLVIGSLPQDLKTQIELLATICQGQDLTDIIGEKSNVVIFEGVEKIIADPVSARPLNEKDKEILIQQGGSLLKKTGYLNLSSYLLNAFSTQILEHKSCLPKEGFIITISEKSLENFWDDLIKFAARKDVPHFYLTGDNHIPLPTLDIINKEEFAELLIKMRITNPLCMPKEKVTDPEQLNLLKALCPSLKMKQDSKKNSEEKEEQITDYSENSMLEISMVLNTSSKKIKLPASTTKNDLLWIYDQKELWESLTYIDLSLCKDLDESILALPMFKPSLDNLKEIILPKELIVNKDVNIQFEPITNDPVILRQWLMKNPAWTPFCTQLYDGIWEYASIFTILAAVSGKMERMSLPVDWTHLDPCSVSLWMYEDSYKLMPKNEIIEINAYHNGELKDENVEEFLDKFPCAQKVCLTGTSVSQIKFNQIKNKEKYKSITFYFEADEKPDSFYSLTKGTVMGEFKIAKGLNLQTCRLFIETFCPDDIQNRQISVMNFKNFDIILKKQTFSFNRFVQNNQDLIELLRLGGDFSLQDAYEFLAPGMSNNVFEIFKSYLTENKTEIPSFKGNAYAFISYMDDMDKLFFYSIEMKLFKFAKIILNHVPTVIASIKDFNDNKNLAIEKAFDSYKIITTKACHHKFYEECTLLKDAYLKIAPHDFFNVNEHRLLLAQQILINEQN